MQNVKEALGIIKQHIDEGNSLHIDFYYSDSFSVSIYEVEELTVDEIENLSINNGNSMIVFNIARCKYITTKPVEEGTVITMMLDGLTLDFVLLNYYLD